MTVVGSATSAWLTIYAIETELVRRYHISNPTLMRIRHYILRMARNLALFVLDVDVSSPIGMSLHGSDKAVSLEALEMLHKEIKKMVEKENQRQIAVQAETLGFNEKGFSEGKGLTDKERKAIRDALEGFLDDLEKISNQVDRVVDDVPNNAERLTKHSEILGRYAWILRRQLNHENRLQNGIENDDIEIPEVQILQNYAISFKVCLEIYKIVNDTLTSRSADE